MEQCIAAIYKPLWEAGGKVGRWEWGEGSQRTLLLAVQIMSEFSQE